MRPGKASELRVASELLHDGIDLYLPCVDDRGIDMVLRVPTDGDVRFYDVQARA